MTDAELQPTYHLLDAVSGWQIAASAGIRIDEDGAITLERLPGAARELVKAEALQAAGLQCAAGLTTDGCSMAWVVDVGAARIFQIDLGTRRVRPLDAPGGFGSATHEFRQPRGIAALPKGEYAIADTGNQRVQVFSRAGLALTRLIESTPPLQEPVGLAADVCSNLYIADRKASVLWHVARNGQATAMGEGDLVEPLRVSVSQGGILAVADRGAGAVWLFEPSATNAYARLTIGEQRPYSVAFDAAGTLYVGDGIGLVHAFVVDDSEASGYRNAGTGDTRVTGEILDLAWVAEIGLLAIIREDREGNPRTLWTIDPRGACTTQGWLITTALNSRIADCQWHRVELQSTFVDTAGSGTDGAASIAISTFVAGEAKIGETLLAGGAIPWRASVTSGEQNPDGLVQSDPGKYLWLRLELRSNSVVTPRIARARVHFPRSSYLQYLPAVYQDDRSSRLFLERFLALFQSGFDALDGSIDRMWLLFDPASVKRSWLLWLSEWVGLVTDPEWSEAELRRAIEQAYAAHLIRGTPAGLKSAIAGYTGVQATVLEHFKLREWTVLANSQSALDGSRHLWSPAVYGQWQLDVYSRVGEFQLVSTPEPAIEPFHWGAHRFTVFFSAEAADVDDVLKRVTTIVEREKPAHTQADYCPVLPRMRVGRQAMVGVDTRVGGVTALTLGRMATLGYDSVLGCSPPELAMRSVAATPRPRLGTSARLH